MDSTRITNNELEKFRLTDFSKFADLMACIVYYYFRRNRWSLALISSQKV